MNCVHNGGSDTKESQILGGRHVITDDSSDGYKDGKKGIVYRRLVLLRVINVALLTDARKTPWGGRVVGVVCSSWGRCRR